MNRSHPWPLISRSVQSSGPKAFRLREPSRRFRRSAVKVTIWRRGCQSRYLPHTFSAKAWFPKHQTPSPLISCMHSVLLLGSVWSKGKTTYKQTLVTNQSSVSSVPRPRKREEESPGGLEERRQKDRQESDLLSSNTAPSTAPASLPQVQGITSFTFLLVLCWTLLATSFLSL